MYPEIYKPHHNYRSSRLKKHKQEVAFRCIHCQAHVYTHPVVAGVQNRNHCPYCLYSRHIDHTLAGDRLSACKSLMQPIGLTVKPIHDKYAKSGGELMLIHRCSECGKLSINRIAADDLVERLMEIFYASAFLDTATRHVLSISKISILLQEDCELVCAQLGGITRL